MSNEQDTSTRTIASVGAVLAIIGLMWMGAESSKQGILAQYIGATKTVSGQNDVQLQDQISALSARIDAMSAAPAAAPAAEEPAAEEPAAEEPAAE
jgi:hypothetical protein